MSIQDAQGAASHQQGAASQEGASSQELHHVHHSYIWLGGLRFVFIVAIAVAASMFSSLVGVIAEGTASGTGGVVLIAIGGASILGLLAFTGIMFLAQWWSYKHLYYVIGSDEFNLYRGIFNKKRVHVPYNKVQSVDQRASLIQRLFGVCMVSIDTAGGASNKAIVIPYMTKRDAEWLRSELFARKRGAAMAAGQQAASEGRAYGVDGDASGGNVLDVGQRVWDGLGGGVFAGESIEEERPSYEYGLTNKELVLAGLSNNTSFAIIMLGIIVFASQILGFISGTFGTQGVDTVAGMAEGLGGYIVRGGVLAIIGSIIPAILFIWVISVAASCVAYGGFKACRRASRIEVQHGLLQHTFQGVDIDRVQSVIVRQSVIRRLFGYCEIALGKVDARTEGDEAKNGSSALKGTVVIHPFVKLSRVPDILDGIAPEFADVPREQIGLAPCALRRGLTRRCIIQGAGFWLALCVLVLQIAFGALASSGVVAFHVSDAPFTVDEQFVIGVICGLLYALAALMTIARAIGSVLWARQSSFAYNERFMRITNGGFSTETISFPRRKIQYGYTKTNPLQRRARTATIMARTAAGVGGTTIALIDVPEKEANAWLDWLEPRVSQEEEAS